jgi:hypothetical protein
MSNQKPVIRPSLASDYAVQTAEPRDLFFYGKAHIIDRVRENLSAFKTVLGDLDLLNPDACPSDSHRRDPDRRLEASDHKVAPAG